MKHSTWIIVAECLLITALMSLPVNGAADSSARSATKQPKPIANSVPTLNRPTPVPAAEVMSVDGRRRHSAPRPGDILEMTCKELGNFEFDQEKGGAIPADIKQLNGITVRLRGYMIPMDQDDQIHQFALTPKIVFKEHSCVVIPTLIQHSVVCDCPKARPVGYSADEMVVEGKLSVEVKKEDGYIMSIFGLDVTSVKPLRK